MLHKSHSRFLPILILIIALVSFLAFGGWRYLTPQFIASNFSGLENWVASHKILAAISFVLVYTFCCAIALPSVIILSLLSGMFFGGLLGGLLSAIGATIGATILYFASNRAIGHYIAEHSGNLIQKFGKYFKKYEFTNLLGLRLIPIAPFFVVTIAAAMFHVRLRNFIAATFIGIFPVETAFGFLGVGLRSKFHEGIVPKMGDFLSVNIVAPLIILAILAAIPNLIDFMRPKSGVQ